MTVAAMRYVLSRIAEALGCSPDEDEDLVEAATRLVAEVERLRGDLARCREAQRATAEGWRHEVAEVASIIGAPAHTAELAACVRAEVERLMRERDEAKEHARLAKMIAARVQAERDEARAEVEKLREAAASSMNLCSWECSDETYCGRCAPLVRALDQEQPEPEEDE